MKGSGLVSLCVGLTCLLVVVLPGCAGPSSDTHAERKYRVVRQDGRVVLGSPFLTAGIPGAGPLTIADIRVWLDDPDVHRPLDFVLPPGLREAHGQVCIPSDNRLTRAKIELGRQLFFDGRLSAFGTFSCATCHRPDQDYTAYMVMPRIDRNPSVAFNRLFSTRQFWDGRVASLEEQPADPIENPLEMGTTREECVARLSDIPGYQLQFDAIFGRLDFAAVSAALACFQRALVTGASPWDQRRLLTGQQAKSLDERPSGAELEAFSAPPMSAAAIRGEELFFSERARCSWCHSGLNFTDEAYHNVGVGMDSDEPDLGRYELTGRDEDRGAFKTPTLRNVARTPPYMHDGSMSTLEQVINWFDRGGFVHDHLDRQIKPLNLTSDEKQDLVEFLQALTGPLPPVAEGRLPE